MSVDLICKFVCISVPLNDTKRLRVNVRMYTIYIFMKLYHFLFTMLPYEIVIIYITNINIV